MKTYLDQLRTILETGAKREDRTGVGTLSCFGMQARYNMADGFPAVTTKKLMWKMMLSELLWFISGSGNINDLKEIYQHNKIWDPNYRDYLDRLGIDQNDGDMGRVYGVQWRHWRGVGAAGAESEAKEIDQLQQAIDTIKTNPASRRIIVNAWNPAEVDPLDVALPPCHSFFQFYVADGKLSLQMYQRSADMFLGVPFNVASYSLLLHIVAKVTGLEPWEFIHTIGDSHIYLDAVDQVREQIEREPLPLPGLHIVDRGQKTIDDFVMDDFALTGYQSHDAIKAKMAV